MKRFVLLQRPSSHIGLNKILFETDIRTRYGGGMETTH